MEPLPSEAFIDIKPELDDDLIAEDPVDIRSNAGRKRGSAARPTAQIYRPGQSRFSSLSSMEGSSHPRPQDSRGSRTSRNGSSKVIQLDDSLHLFGNVCAAFYMMSSC